MRGRRATSRLLACAVLAVLGAAPAATATTALQDAGPIEVKRARSGAVVAELSYRKNGPYYSGVRLRIVRAGIRLVSVPVRALEEPGAFLFDLVARDLDGGEPEVVLKYFTGGAYCCTTSLVYRYDSAAKSYRRLSVDWGTFGYGLVDLDRDGRPEFESGDTRLDQAFTAHVISSAPIRIWRHDAGRMVDVTREFPGRIARDLAGARRTYEKYRGDTQADMRGLLVAYVGDLYLLGRGAEATRVLDEALRRGELDRGGGPAGKAYVRALLALLRKTGYLQASG